MLCYVIIKYKFSLETTQMKLKHSKRAPLSFLSCSELVRDCFQIQSVCSFFVYMKGNKIVDPRLSHSDP